MIEEFPARATARGWCAKLCGLEALQLHRGQAFPLRQPARNQYRESA